MATTNELLKQLRDKAKSGKKGSKTADKAFKKEGKQIITEELGIEIKCPRCGSTNYVKDGEGRFKCKDCDKKFRPTSGSILAGYDFTHEEWLSIVDCVLNGREVQRFSGTVKYSMSRNKAWLLRLKILSAFNNMPQPKLTGIVQVDGTYFRESQKSSKNLISFVEKKETRKPRYHYEPSLCGIFGQEFICCVAGIDNSNKMFAKCISLGTPSYERLEELLDNHLNKPSYLCSDAHFLYEDYCDAKNIHHQITPSSFKNEKFLAGYIEQSDKYHPLPLNNDEINENEKVLKRMFEERSGPHIRNSGPMTYDAYKIIVNEETKKYFGLDRINEIHGQLKNKLCNDQRNVSSHYLNAYVAMEVYKHNFPYEHGHVIGDGLNDYEIIFNDINKYYNADSFKQMMETDVSTLKFDEKANRRARERIKGAKNILTSSRNIFDCNGNDSEIGEIFNRRRCFRMMNPRRVNYLCRYFGIPASGKSKTQKADALGSLPNADEIIFREIYLLYFATTDEVMEAVNEGFFENKNKKRGRKKNATKTLVSEGIKTKEELDEIKKQKKIFFDTETTGLTAGYDELLSLTIIDENKIVLFNEMFKPVHRKTWSAAEKINHISPSDVESKLPFSDYKTQIQSIIDRYELFVGYKIEFDISFLKAQGIHISHTKKTFDVMYEYSRVLGDAKNHKLVHCADYYKFDWANAQHSSLGDTEATLHCFNKMTEFE